MKELEETKDPIQENIRSSLSQRQKYDKTNKKYRVLLSAFMFHFLFGGFNAMIGVVFVDIVRAFNADRSVASLMQSLSSAFMFGGGSVGEYIMRKFGMSRCVMIGSLLISICMMATAFSTDIITVVVLIGIGSGAGLTMPLLATFIGVGNAFGPTSFSKFMAYALTGGGVGAIVLPYLSDLLIQEYGWRGMFIVMSGLFLNFILFTLLMHLNLPKTREKATTHTNKKTSCNMTILRNASFLTLLIVDIPFGLTGYIEFWFIPDYVVTRGYTREQGSVLLTVVGGFSILGRFLAGFVHPICTYTKTKIIYYWIILFSLLAVAHSMYPMFPEYPVMFGASVLYGVTFGMIYTQSYPIVREIVSLENFPVAVALHNTVYGISSAVCGVFTGSITDKTGSYDTVFYLSAIASLFCGFCCLLLLIFDVIKRRFAKPKSQVLQISHI